MIPRMFVGFDSRQPEAFEACVESIKQHTSKLNWSKIKPINKMQLEQDGLYWREQDPNQSTEFSFTRFLTPYLSGYHGYSIFCDSDFIWRCDPFKELMEVIDPNKAVSVVMHNLQEKDIASVKMNGKKQVWYPRKNWTSLMVFNNGHVANHRLLPVTVSEAPAKYLHEMIWCEDYLGSLPKTYNHLVGYYGYDERNPKAIHFTDGGPWHKGYEDVEFAELWEQYYDAALKRHVQPIIER